MEKPTYIHWFRQDLRLEDNPALSKAAALGTVLPLYILDDDSAGEHTMGAASRWWLHHSLCALEQSLGIRLNIYRGQAEACLNDILKRYPIKGVFWNRCYEPWRMERDARIKKTLRQNGIDAESFNGFLLWEPWDIQKQDGTPYKVFTPFYRKGCLNASPPRSPLPPPARLDLVRDEKALGVEDLNLRPHLRWDVSLEGHWMIGEEGAKKRLSEFLKKGLPQYKEGRNFPAQPFVSRLSPHLHFGEISPQKIWHEVSALEQDKNIDHFQSELGWREFSYHLLYQFPDLPHKNLQSKFDHFPWQNDKENLKRWQKGQTGYPIIDAGMRELWQTGYMHNRVRMIVGSFLVKNLRMHWRHGERWFWDCLVDADLANNSAGWQWIAGCGADAAPYFRIFNPILQGEKFDPHGDYTRRFVPELKNLPEAYLFKPWQAPQEILRGAGVVLGKTYPFPIVDGPKSAAMALEAFSHLKTLEEDKTTSSQTDPSPTPTKPVP